MPKTDDEQKSESYFPSSLRDDINDLRRLIGQSIGYGLLPEPEYVTIDSSLISNKNIDRLSINSILERLNNIEKEIRMKVEKKDVFNYEADDFDGLKALREIRKDAEQALVSAAVTIEDNKNFLKARGIKLSQ